MMAKKDVSCLAFEGIKLKNFLFAGWRRKKEKPLKFKRKHFSEMSDGIFYYPKYLLYGKFIYILLQSEDDTKQSEKSLSNLGVFLAKWMDDKGEI